MCARIDNSPGPAPAYDIEPVSNQAAVPQTSATTAVDEQTEGAVDQSAAAGKRMESSLEASFMRGQLDTQPGPVGGVLYDKRSHDPAGTVDEIKAPRSASVVGTKLGTSKDGKDLQIKKDIGAPEGYDDEREAIAAARMAGTEPAAVVKINNKWHAVETSADPSYSDGAATTRQHTEAGVEIQGLPPYSDVEKQANKIAASRDPLQAEADIARYHGILDKSPSASEVQKNREYLKSDKLGESDKAKLRDTLPENRKQVEDKLKQLETKYPTRLSDDEKSKLKGQLATDRQAMAPLLFGLPKSQIQFNSSSDRDDPDKMINVDPMPPNQTGDILGREHYPQNKQFEPGLKPTFGIKLEEMDDPKGAAGVLFHETSHLQDDQRAQNWVKQYEKDHTFVATPKGMEKFQAWMSKQVGKRLPTDPADPNSPSGPPLTKADVELVVDKAYNFGATSEARAYVHAAIAAAQSGNKAEAISQLKTYASTFNDPKTPSPASGSEVQAALTKELQDVYRKHPELRDSLRAALDAAKAANPKAWISEVKLSK